MCQRRQTWARAAGASVIPGGTSYLAKVIPPEFAAEHFSYPRTEPWYARLLRSRRREWVEQRASELRATRLQAHLVARLASADDPRAELERVVAELRGLGHALVVEADDADGILYADTPHRRLGIWAHWARGAKPLRLEVLWERL